MHARLLAVVLLALAASQGAALSHGKIAAQTTGAGRACAGLAVATAPLPPGSPLVSPEVVLSTVDGSERLRVDFGQPALAWPSSLDGVSILRTLGGDYALLTAETGTVVPLEFPGANPGSVDHRSFQFLGSSGQRFQLFGNYVSLEAWLVDLRTGSVLSLSTLLEKPQIITSAQISSDDHWLVFLTGAETFLLDLTASAGVQMLDSSARSSTPSFSDDGSTLFYLREANGENAEIVALNLQAGHTQVLAAAAPWTGLRGFPGDLVFGWQDGLLFRIPVDGSSPIAILGSPERATPLTIDPSGSRILISREIDDVTSWVLAGTNGGGVQELQSLAGMEMLNPQPAAAWALFAKSRTPLAGVPGTPYLSLDLASGLVTTVLAQDGSAIYTSGYDSSADGRYQLMQAVQPGSGRLWLIDGRAGISFLAGSSFGNASGALSPDGCYLAVGTFAALGEGRQGQVEVRDLETGHVTATIPDSVLLGWANVPR